MNKRLAWVLGYVCLVILLVAALVISTRPAKVRTTAKPKVVPWTQWTVTTCDPCYRVTINQPPDIATVRVVCGEADNDQILRADRNALRGACDALLELLLESGKLHQDWGLLWADGDLVPDPAPWRDER